MRPILVVTALPSESTPLADAWGLKPVRNNALLARFQVAACPNDERFVAVSGMGKLKAAAATAAVYAELSRQHPLLIANVGLAGAHPEQAAVGTAVLINKVRDAANGMRFYPDVLLRHSLLETALETHDAPVKSPPHLGTLVDMEGSGFMQAATLLVAPSEIALIKVISDYCDGCRLTPADAKALIGGSIDGITTVLDTMQRSLAAAPALSETEAALLESVINHAHFSQSQRLELSRVALHRKAQNTPFIAAFEEALTLPASTKPERAALYRFLLTKLSGVGLP